MSCLLCAAVLLATYEIRQDTANLAHIPLPAPFLSPKEGKILAERCEAGELSLLDHFSFSHIITIIMLYNYILHLSSLYFS